MTFKKTIMVLATVGLIAFFIMETTDKTGGDESTVPREMETAENVLILVIPQMLHSL